MVQKSKQKIDQIKIINKVSITNYLNEKEEFLNTQKNIHISKREETQNLVYLNSQLTFIQQMKENLSLE